MNIKEHKSNILLGVSLIGLSIVLHFVHYLVFQDVHHIMVFLLADIAFIPLEVFFVSLVLERAINKQEERSKRKKTHMLVQLFYLDLGNDFLTFLARYDHEVLAYQKELAVSKDWNEQRYKDLGKIMHSLTWTIEEIDSLDFIQLRDMLRSKKSLLTTLIANPMTLEHEGFSDALMVIFHLYDELERRNIPQLSAKDQEHLITDINRAYHAVVMEWVSYMKHIGNEYPYLYATAIRTNPFILSCPTT